MAERVAEEVVREPFGMSDMVNRSEMVTTYEIPDAKLLDVAVTDGAVWALTGDSGPWYDGLGRPRDGGLVLRRVDPASGRVGATVELRGTPDVSASVFAAGGSVWVSTEGRSVLHRIDPVAASVVATTDVPPEVVGLEGDVQLAEVSRLQVSVAESGVWVSGDFARHIGRLDLVTNEIVEIIELTDPSGWSGQYSSRWIPRHVIAMSGDELWRGSQHQVDRIDLVSGEVTASFDLNPPAGTGYGLIGSIDVYELFATDDAVWVVAAGVVFRIDPATDQLVGAIPLLSNDRTVNAALAGDMLLVALGSSIYAVDTTTNAALAGSGIGTDAAVADLAPLGDRVWARRVSRCHSLDCETREDHLAWFPLGDATQPRS